tara:strand:+ start:101 stop:433 length:333 start_codon:yes stop_codon:yes gene_type:complete
MNSEQFSNFIQKAKSSPNGSWWRGLCPAHNDKNPSLYWFESNVSGRVIVKCRSGCTTENILSALNLNGEDLSGVRIQRPSRKDSRYKGKKRYRHRQRLLLEKAIKKGSSL